MKNYVAKGDSIDTVLANTVKGGDVVILGNLVGVAVSDGDGEGLRTVKLKGVFTLPKLTGAVTVGQAIYYKVADKKVTTTSTDNTLIGVAFTAAGSSDETVDVALTNNL